MWKKCPKCEVNLLGSFSTAAEGSKINAGNIWGTPKNTDKSDGHSRPQLIEAKFGNEEAPGMWKKSPKCQVNLLSSFCTA